MTVNLSSAAARSASALLLASALAGCSAPQTGGRINTATPDPVDAGDLTNEAPDSSTDAMLADLAMPDVAAPDELPPLPDIDTDDEGTVRDADSADSGFVNEVSLIELPADIGPDSTEATSEIQVPDVPCQPDCEGRVCGDDRCGGECGPGCDSSQRCNAEGSRCFDVDARCVELAPTGSLQASGDRVFEMLILDPALGGDAPDGLRFEFYDVSTGTFDLGSDGENDNYATCVQCVRLFMDAVDGVPDREFYADQGTLVVDQESVIGGPIQWLYATLQNVVLHEVTITAGTFESVLVPGGDCYVISNQFIYTSPL